MRMDGRTDDSEFNTSPSSLRETGNKKEEDIVKERCKKSCKSVGKHYRISFQAGLLLAGIS